MQKTESQLQALIRDQTLESNVAFPQSAVLNTINNFIIIILFIALSQIKYLPRTSEGTKIYVILTAAIGQIKKKVRLLLSKLGAAEHDKFVDYILPQKTCELTFTETVKLLKERFSPKTSLFHKRWKCLNLTKKDDEDYLTFSSVVYKHCDEFKVSDLSADDFKCLIFVQGLRNPTNSFNQIGEWTNLTLKKLAEDGQRIISIKKDSRDIDIPESRTRQKLT